MSWAHFVGSAPANACFFAHSKLIDCCCFCCSYDLLFGLTENEAYHTLNAVGLTHGLLENERDGYLRFYMQNRFEIRPDIAMTLTLQEYNDMYDDAAHPKAEEHRDVVLDILSDARVAAPLLQTGIYQSKVNPSSYMYLFSHISKAGQFTNVSEMETNPMRGCVCVCV